jgi:hypothetical protein
MIISCDTSQQSELRVRLSTTSASSSSSPTSSRSNSRRFIHAVEAVADCSSSNSSSSGHSRDDDDLDTMVEGKGHPHYSHQAGSTLSDLIRSMHIVLIWAVAKSKMRHILGLYTFMITIMLHFSSSSINNIQSIVEKGSIGMSTTSIRHLQQQPSV